MKVKLIQEEIKRLHNLLSNFEMCMRYYDPAVCSYYKSALENFLSLEKESEKVSWIKEKQKEIKVGTERIEDNYSVYHFEEEFDDAYDAMDFSNYIIGLELAVDFISKASDIKTEQNMKRNIR